MPLTREQYRNMSREERQRYLSALTDINIREYNENWERNKIDGRAFTKEVLSHLNTHKEEILNWCPNIHLLKKTNNNFERGAPNWISPCIFCKHSNHKTTFTYCVIPYPEWWKQFIKMLNDIDFHYFPKKDYEEFTKTIRTFFINLIEEWEKNRQDEKEITEEIVLFDASEIL